MYTLEKAEENTEEALLHSLMEETPFVRVSTATATKEVVLLPSWLTFTKYLLNKSVSLACLVFYLYQIPTQRLLSLDKAPGLIRPGMDV